MKQINYEKYIVKILAQEIFLNWKMPFSVERASQGIGTGFLISPDGLILTCGHVIEQSVKIYIEMPSEGFKRYDADIIGFCPSDEVDVGLLKIRNFHTKHYLHLGDSFKLKQGDNVLAVGFPLGQSYLKYTEGIISGFQDGIIQTDTPINPGNSGGPLIYKNKVVGVVVSKMMKAENIGYAVPIAQYKVIKDELMKDTIVRKPELGIEYNETDSKLLKHYGSKCKNGIYISNIFNKSPIAKTGLKKGSILCSFDGHQLDNYGQIKLANFKVDLYNYIYFIPKNKTIEIKWWGDKHLHTSNFKYSQFILPIRQIYPVYEQANYSILGGIIMMNLNLNIIPIYPFKLNKYMRLSECTIPRIIITSILPGSSTKKSSILNEGDIVKKINDIDVYTVDDVAKIINNLGISDIVIENDKGNVYVANMKDLINETNELAKFYKI